MAATRTRRNLLEDLDVVVQLEAVGTLPLVTCHTRAFTYIASRPFASPPLPFPCSLSVNLNTLAVSLNFFLLIYISSLRAFIVLYSRWFKVTHVTPYTVCAISLAQVMKIYLGFFEVKVAERFYFIYFSQHFSRFLIFTRNRCLLKG